MFCEGLATKEQLELDEKMPTSPRYKRPPTIITTIDDGDIFLPPWKVLILNTHKLASYANTPRIPGKRRRQKWELFPSRGLVYCPLCKLHVILEKVGYMQDLRKPDRYRCSRCLLQIRPNTPKYITKAYPSLSISATPSNT